MQTQTWPSMSRPVMPPNSVPDAVRQPLSSVARKPLLEQRNLLVQARAHRAAILPICMLVRRYGESRILSEPGKFGERGAILA